MRNRIFNRSSTGPPRSPRSRRYMRRIRAAHLLRPMLRERRTRRRYSIGKKSSCSSNFWNGESARRMCRKEPTLTSMLFAKAFDKTPSEALGFASSSSVSYDLVLPGKPISMRRRQVQNGAIGDAEQSGRADEGGVARAGKPAGAPENEPPQPLPLTGQRA